MTRETLDRGRTSINPTVERVMITMYTLSMKLHPSNVI